MAENVNKNGDMKYDQRLRVLIADDVQATRRSTKLMMRLIPEVEVVAVASNGRQAVELAQVHKPDIALLDVKMPEMTGIEATQAMLKANPYLACVILSAERDRHTLRQAVSAGAKGYLIKPFTSQQLVETVNRVIQQLKTIPRKTYVVPVAEPEPVIDLRELAAKYIKARRTDDEALELFERLAEDPNCDIRWLRQLAIMYVLRGRWGRLRILSGRLEKLTAANAYKSHA